MKVAIIYNQDITGVINTLGMQNKEFYSPKNVMKVAKNLESAGHNVSILDGNMHIIDRLKTFMPRAIEGEQMGMVFNMAYGIQGESRYTHIPSLLEMLGIPYVGSSPSGHALALDKVMTKIVWQNRGLPTPDFWVFNSASEDMSNVIFPVIVKPKMESVSFGLRVVHNESDLKEAVEFIVAEFQQQALVEQFIRGREFCVGLLGNSPIEAFPVLEIDLNGDPDAIQTVTDKKEKPKQKICPAQLSTDLAEKMINFSKEAFKALELRDFARVDIRLDENNNIYLLEINSMASLGETGSYPTAAKVAGYDFSKLVNKMLDVAAVRYFSSSFLSAKIEADAKMPLNSRLRSFIRSRQENTEKLLQRLVNIDTHVRNIEGINKASNLIKAELSQLGFANEVFPQLEVGNMMFFTNSEKEELDYLLLLSLDDGIDMPDHETYQSTEHKLYGTGIWENKGGIVTALSALQSLRFAKLLRKLSIGILLITDSSIAGKFSRGLIVAKSLKTKHLIGMHGGNIEGGIITSRSGSASYTYSLKLVDISRSENVAMASQVYFKSLAAITELSKNQPENVIAPYSTRFASNIFKKNAFGSAKISVRFNSMEEFKLIDEKIKRLIVLPKAKQKLVQVQFEGGISRPPMHENEETNQQFEKIREISRKIDTRVVKEHRWSSSDICSVNSECTKVDGMGPVGGFDNQRSEYILRHSLIDRALVLALLMNTND